MTVLENQKIKIRSRRNVQEFQINSNDAVLLRQVELRNNGIFKWGFDTITPQQWIGVISTKDLNIEILPKISESYDIDEIRQKLLYMFQVAHDIPTRTNINSKVRFAEKGILEILISNFLAKLEQYLQSGMVRTYEKQKRNLHAIKGTIVFNEQIRKNNFNLTRFVCRYSKLVEDNLINRLLKRALSSMRKVSHDNSNIEWIKRMLPVFEDVSDIGSNLDYKKTLVFNRHNNRVVELIEYCELFFSGMFAHLNIGNNMVHAVLFDMNKLFELFIYKSLKKVYGHKVLNQVSGTYLLESLDNGKKRVNLRPDIWLDLYDGYRIIIDTKWKKINRFIKESDVYQMNAYTTAISNVKETILIYPFVKGSGRSVGDYLINNQLGNNLLKVRTIDLKYVDNIAKFSEHLREIIET
ncbi:5-methylcytosine restriction system specificity protein McrC [Paenibacillus polymyxa]|uniref:McrC family protein n=1 Tax=Paenibacillus polymyxa TaxID=1406 RepID=UPI00298CA9F3|nr:hypothetical protein [Paenibacillus polymyxa]